MLSDNLLIEQSDQLRRMDVGEVMEVFQGETAALEQIFGQPACRTKELYNGCEGKGLSLASAKTCGLVGQRLIKADELRLFKRWDWDGLGHFLASMLGCIMQLPLK